MRMTCEEWFSRLRHSLASAAPEKQVIVGSDNDRELPAHLVTVGEFHRECVRVAAKLEAAKTTAR